MTTHAEIADAVMDYLNRNAPEVAKLIKREPPNNDEIEKSVAKSFSDFIKDMTAGDGHVPTALGNAKKDKKVSFAETLGDDEKKKKKTAKAWELPLKFVKAEPDKQLVFGWASIATRDGQIVVDKQGDMIMPEDLEAAAYDFVLNYRSQGDMHKMDAEGDPLRVGNLVESMIFTKQKQDLMSIDLGLEGWWVGFKVCDEGVWKKIKTGERPEFSIGGTGKRIEV